MIEPKLLKKNALLFMICVRLMDILLCAFAGWGVGRFYFKSGFPLLPNYWIVLFIGCLISGVCLNKMKIYMPFRVRGLVFVFYRLVGAVILTGLVLMALAFLLKVSAEYSRIWFAGWMVSYVFLLIAFRTLVFGILRAFRKKGYNLRKILLIGSESLMSYVEQGVKRAPWTGLQVALKHVYLAQENYLSELIATGFLEGFDEVWICLSLSESRVIQAILKDLQHCPLNVRLVPDFSDIPMINHDILHLSGMTLMNLRVTPLHGVNEWVKWLEDKIIALIILMLISPLLLLISILVKCSSKGPVFYQQERVSWNGKSFKMLKFRSMPVDVESKTGAVWAKSGEKRSTRIGGFLRKTSLDELPQFLNVLKGEMSIVGPRPERPVFVEKFKREIPGYMQKHLVKAGITGWAQIQGWRGDTDLARRIECDLYYIEHWSLWLDLKIIFLTVFKGFVHKNAY